MAIVYSIDSRKWSIEQWASLTITTNQLRLYSNDVTPTESTTAASLTEITDFWAYSSPISIATSGLDGSNRGYVTTSTITFTHDGMSSAVTVYGWFILNTYDYKLMFAERLSTPKYMATTDDGLSIALTFRMTQGTF